MFCGLRRLAHVIRSVLSCLWTGAECVCVCVRACVRVRDTAPDHTSFFLNGKHIYTVWIVPCPLYSALRAIHHTENTNSVNKWPISAAASASIYSVGGGRFEF